MVIILIAGRIWNLTLIHPIRLNMKSICTRISIIILRILIDYDYPYGFTLERLLGERDCEIPHERWFRSNIHISAAIGAPRIRSQDNQCPTLQKKEQMSGFWTPQPRGNMYHPSRWIRIRSFTSNQEQWCS
jgi:hypothetical protein